MFSSNISSIISLNRNSKYKFSIIFTYNRSITINSNNSGNIQFKSNSNFSILWINKFRTLIYFKYIYTTKFNIMYSNISLIYSHNLNIRFNYISSIIIFLCNSRILSSSTNPYFRINYWVNSKFR